MDKAPLPVVLITPVYPPELKANRIRAEVTAVFIVDETGVVTKASIEESSDERFNASAFKAIQQWRFQPGVRNDKAVRTRVRQPFKYALTPIEAHDIDGLDVKPEVLESVTPRYPRALKRLRKQATVIVEFVVDETGKVVDWEIEESTNQQFNESALTAIKQWTFKPGKIEGVPVKARVRIPFSYSLRG